SDSCKALTELERSRLVRRDLGRWGGGQTPPGSSLATSEAPYAARLRTWFPTEIRVPFPYPTDEIPAVPTNLCHVSELRARVEERRLVVEGRLSVASLPPGYDVGSHSAQPGAYRRWIVGYVVSADGKVLWMNESAATANDWNQP